MFFLLSLSSTGVMKCAGSLLVLDITKHHPHSDGKMVLSKEDMEVVEWAFGVTGRKHLHTVLPLLKVYVTSCKKLVNFYCRYVFD